MLNDNILITNKFKEYIRLKSDLSIDNKLTKLTYHIIVILLTNNFNITRYINIHDYHFEKQQINIINNYVNTKNKIVDYIKENNLYISFILNKKQIKGVYKHIMYMRKLIKSFQIKLDVRTQKETEKIYLERDIVNRMTLLKLYITEKVIESLDMKLIQVDKFTSMSLSQQIQYYENLIFRLKNYYITSFQNILKYIINYNILINEVKNQETSIKKELLDEFNDFLKSN